MKLLEELSHKIQLTEPPVLSATGLVVMYKIYCTDQILMADPRETGELLKELEVIWRCRQDGDDTIITIKMLDRYFSDYPFKRFAARFKISNEIAIFCAALVEQKKLQAMIKEHARSAREEFEARSPFAYCNDIIKSFAPFL